jgi:hypothetical protein
MSEKIEIKRLSTGTIFKVLLIGGAFSIVPFSLVMGILSLFGASTVTWNDQPLTGFSGLIAAPFIGAFITLVISGLFGLFMAAGLWVYSKFKPLTLHYWQTNE